MATASVPAVPTTKLDTDQREAVNMAMLTAWGVYLGLGGLPALASVIGIWTSLLAETSSPEVNMWFMLASCAWLTFGVPAALLFRRSAFSEFYKGKPVSPANFLKGSIPLWVVLVTGGLIAQLGWIVSGTPVVSGFIAACALIVFLVFYPTGVAMLHPVGGHDDAAVYEEPA
ncbi:MAG: hypothetical protein AAGD32_06855 [Planctomycetota bacterium]